MKANELLPLLTILILGSLNCVSQNDEQVKSSHQGIFLQVTQSKQVFKNEFASSKYLTGFAIGIQQHFDLSSKFQLRLGGAVSSIKIDEIDYSPTFGTDLDTLTWEVDIYKSYVHNVVNLLQVQFPINVRFKLAGETNHIYLAGGLEGRFVISDKFNTRIQESGYGYLDIDNEPFFKTRSPTISGLIDLGYEFPVRNRKVNVSIISKFGLNTQFKGEGGAFMNVIAGRSFDVGFGIGMIF